MRAPHLGIGRQRNDSTGSNADDQLVLGGVREGPYCNSITDLNVIIKMQETLPFIRTYYL